MSANKRFHASGWRGREVEIPRPGDLPGPALLEFKGGVTTSFTVTSLYRSPTRMVHGEQLLYSWGPKVRQVLLPAGYNRVEIRRVKPSGNTGTGFSRWRLRTLEIADLPSLADTLSGKHETVVYFADHARVSFVWRGTHENGELLFTPEGGDTAKELTQQGDIRGTVAVPGRGFLVIRSEKWTLERR